jgi:hypothetical protein
MNINRYSDERIGVAQELGPQRPAAAAAWVSAAMHRLAPQLVREGLSRHGIAAVYVYDKYLLVHVGAIPCARLGLRKTRRRTVVRGNRGESYLY